ncbi:hypothetical protein BDR26DRAFT_897954 [Obelidium mucronatum]|nr:hypothetical protein BDR26DRAFT_897954 [Obelidium mucronatum]
MVRGCETNSHIDLRLVTLKKTLQSPPTLHAREMPAWLLKSLLSIDNSKEIWKAEFARLSMGQAPNPCNSRYTAVIQKVHPLARFESEPADALFQLQSAVLVFNAHDNGRHTHRSSASGTSNTAKAATLSGWLNFKVFCDLTCLFFFSATVNPKPKKRYPSLMQAVLKRKRADEDVPAQNKRDSSTGTLETGIIPRREFETPPPRNASIDDDADDDILLVLPPPATAAFNSQSTPFLKGTSSLGRTDIVAKHSNQTPDDNPNPVAKSKLQQKAHDLLSRYRKSPATYSSSPHTPTVSSRHRGASHTLRGPERQIQNEKFLNLLSETDLLKSKCEELNAQVQALRSENFVLHSENHELMAKRATITSNRKEWPQDAVLFEAIMPTYPAFYSRLGEREKLALNAGVKEFLTSNMANIGPCIAQKSVDTQLHGYLIPLELVESFQNWAYDELKELLVKLLLQKPNGA